MKKAYEKIVDDMEKAIRMGDYKVKEKLPSIRRLCELYSCSQSTAVKAYDVLRSKHLIYSIPQSGSYVVEQMLQANPVQNDLIDFSRGNPLFDSGCIPNLKHCLDRAVDLCNINDTDCHEIYGIPSLREVLPKYLADFQVFAASKSVFVNLGVQQALTILNQMPFPNGRDVILVEQPTFRYCNSLLSINGARVEGIARNEKGVDLAVLESLFKNANIKFFYTVPRSHNPLGICYSKAQRKEIVALAIKYGVYIVEDDYFGDVAVKLGDTLHSYGDSDYHIYLKSFIKTIPWLRIGIAVIPAPLLSVFTQYAKRAYYHSYFSPSMLSQAALEVYIRSGMLKRHAAFIEAELSTRLCCLRKHFNQALQYGAVWVGGESGFYHFLKLPNTIHEMWFVERLKKRGVLVTPGSECFLRDHAHVKGIRISVARSGVEEIQRGVAVIYDELARLKTKV